MSNCKKRLEELVYTKERVLDEDIAAIKKWTDRSRIERYNELKEDEENFLWDYSKECKNFLTDSERNHIRSEFRLARLLIAASFHDEGSIPQSLEDEFIEKELNAVREFEEYKQFDAYSEEQIKNKIRRMEGEVYDLVKNYYSTQIANMDKLMEDSDVQQDVMERLIERYEERYEKIRQGFYTYIETHGLEHMVESVEEAVKRVNESSNKRKELKQEIDKKMQEMIEAVDYRMKEGRKEAHKEALMKLDKQMGSIEDMKKELEDQMKELKETQEKTEEAKKEEAQNLIENEVTKLRQERENLTKELNQLKRKKKEIKANQKKLEEKKENLKKSLKEDEKLEGDNVVTTKMARLMEMNYIGRFDTTIHRVSEIETPDKSYSISKGYWKDRSERKNKRPTLVELLDPNEDPNKYPENLSARYEVTSSKFLGLSKSTELIIEASMISDLEAYAENGFDAIPADLDAFLSEVNRVVREAEKNDYKYILGLISPTGWSEEVKKQLKEVSKGSRYSKDVSICLVDLQSGELVYDRSDELMDLNSHLFKPQVEEELIKNCLETIEQGYIEDLGTDSVLMSTIADEHNFEPNIVKRAFNELESREKGEQMYLNDYGLALSFKD